MTKVLVIEPNRVLASHYATALQKNAHTAVWRSCGQSAINAAERARPDAILLELQLPAHSGLEFLHELRSYPEWQAIPVILLTLVPAAALEAEKSALEQLGVMDYLYKPKTKLEHVIKAVDRLFEDEELNRYPRHSFSSY